MPEIRERNSEDLIKSKGKGKHRSKKGSIMPWIDNAVRGNTRKHQDKKEEANEYAVGVTEEAAAEVAIRAKDMPGDVKRTIEHLQSSTEERELNSPAPEELEPEEPGHAPNPDEQQWEFAEKKTQENADAPPSEDPQYPTNNYSNDAPQDPTYANDHFQNYPLEQHYVDTPQYTKHHDPASLTEASKQSGAPNEGNSTGGSKPDVREKPKGNAEPKQKPQYEPKTRSRTEKSLYKTSRPSKQAQAHGAVQKSAAQKTADKGRKKFQQETQKKMSNKAIKKTAENAKKAAVAVGKAVKSVVEAIVAAFGSIGLVAILAVIVVIGALLASPLGILFSNESTPNSVPLSSAISQINMELNSRLISLQSGEYDDIIVEGAPPSWTDVVAVFAAYTAGAENGVDVAQLNPDRVSRLQSVFWQMCFITSSTESVTISDSNPDDDIDDSRTETTLTITITGKTAQEMRSVLGFSDFQNEAMDVLLSDPTMLSSLIGNMSISQQDALELLRSLPQDLSPERRAVVQHALSLVGKVNYFWGGKSLVLGWDSRWGQLKKVSAKGSPTTGTYRLYGLDCSGFVDWVFYNASNGEYIIGQGGGAESQHEQCIDIAWEQAQPGDLVFYSNDDHVGIIGGRDAIGNILVVHCSSEMNNVMISLVDQFECVAVPQYFSTSQYSDQKRLHYSCPLMCRAKYRC